MGSSVLQEPEESERKVLLFDFSNSFIAEYAEERCLGLEFQDEECAVAKAQKLAKGREWQPYNPDYVGLLDVLCTWVLGARIMEVEFAEPDFESVKHQYDADL